MTQQTIDLLAIYTRIGQERKMHTDKAAVLEQEQKAILDELDRRGISSGTIGNFAITRKEVRTPVVANWDLLMPWIRTNNALDLFERRLTKSAAMARIDDGVALPGVVVEPRVGYTIKPLA